MSLTLMARLGEIPILMGTEEEVSSIVGFGFDKDGDEIVMVAVSETGGTERHIMPDDVSWAVGGQPGYLRISIADDETCSAVFTPMLNSDAKEEPVADEDVKTFLMRMKSPETLIR
ncbi:MAG: hypothetical protein U9N14_04505, partial [Pseudomonadota bacterium]|nr:hypothetical protein [Pseudomonadota bacterium]